MTTPSVLNLTEYGVMVHITRFKVPQNGGFRGLKGFVYTQQFAREKGDRILVPSLIGRALG
jgi:hypothetical protein